VLDQQRLLELWAADLRMQIEELRRGDVPRGFLPIEHAAQRATALHIAESTLDLVRRGLDPGKPRRFRGRISLTVRCEAKGHQLGHVYPTRFSPIFVPTVAEMWGQRPREKRDTRDVWLLPDLDDPMPLQVLTPEFLAERPGMDDDELAMWMACRCSGAKVLRLDRLKAALVDGERLVAV